MKRIGVIDFSLSNIESVFNALTYLNIEFLRVNNKSQLGHCSHLILPGVGTYFSGMQCLDRLSLIEPIIKEVKKGKPILGLCLGMQLFANNGDEYGPLEGLGLIDGDVTRIELEDPKLRLPHIGWNEVKQCRPNRLLSALDPNPTFYFIHSYSYSDVNADYVIATVDYGKEIVASIEKDNIFGAQFHPEKSQSNGIIVIKNFINTNT